MVIVLTLKPHPISIVRIFIGVFNMNKWLLFVIPFVAIMISGLTWWLNQPNEHDKVSIFTLPTNCQLHTGDCMIEQEGLSVKLSINPQPIPIAKALNIKANIEGAAATQVQLDINGSNMYMGYNRINLNHNEHDEWQGKSILSFCTIDEMQWQITLLITLADGRQIQAPFPLTTPFREAKP